MNSYRCIVLLIVLFLTNITPLFSQREVSSFLELYGVRAVQLDLDLIYDPNQVEFRRRVDLVLDRLISIGANLVLLQVFQDPDGDGSANGVYFKTDMAPSLDALGTFLEEARERNIKIFAWMTTLTCSWVLEEHPNWEILSFDPDSGSYVTGKYWYRRASPFCDDFVAYLRDLYADLASYPLDGILLQDDLYLGEWEDFSEWARSAFRKEYGLELTPSLLKMGGWREKWINWKAERLMHIARILEETVKERRPEAIFSIDVYSDVLIYDDASSWLAQDKNLLANSDFFMVIMAYPFLENADNPEEWMEAVAREAVTVFGKGKTLIKVQSYDWKNELWIPSNVFSSIIEAAYEGGAVNVGYYPEDPFSGIPDAQTVRNAFLVYGTTPSRPVHVLMLSNSVDLPAARKLAVNIGRHGVLVTLTNENVNISRGAMIILGGPKAYEGIGDISNGYLPKPQAEKLISEEDSMVSIVSRKNEIDYVIIAGHTRIETARAASEFPAPWIRLTALSDYILGCRPVRLGPVVYSYQGVTFEDLSKVNATILVVDPDDSRLSKEDTVKLHEQGKTVIAYLSIGQAESYRSYWDDKWELDTPRWLGTEDLEWPENYWVRYWDQEWKNIVFTCLHEIIEKGFDGVLLDRVDAYEYWEDKGVLDAKQKMLNFVLEISARAKQERCFLIIPQNAEELIEDHHYLEAIDGVSSEDVWTIGNDERPQDEVELRLNTLDRIISRGKLVLVLDYPSSAKMREIFCLKARERGYIPYSSSIDLSGINYDFLNRCWEAP